MLCENCHEKPAVYRLDGPVSDVLVCEECRLTAKLYAFLLASRFGAGGITAVSWNEEELQGS